MGPTLATTVPSLLPLQATSVITAVTPPTTMALINRPAWFTTPIFCPCCAASNESCGLKVVGDEVAGRSRPPGSTPPPDPTAHGAGRGLRDQPEAVRDVATVQAAERARALATVMPRR